jgi:NACalpha-BTF3-like transcription factor
MSETKTEMTDATQTSKRPMSKFEKKSRQSIQKMGFKYVSDINRATMKKGEAFVFAIDPCDIFQKGSHYVIFGEGRVDEAAARLSSQLASLAQNMGNPGTAPPSSMANNTFNPFQTSSSKADEIDSDDDVNADEVSSSALDFSSVSFGQQEVDMVMSQANASPSEAFEALEKTGGDPVTAIMELAM